MARYTDEELNHLKTNTSLLRLAESQGYLKQRGLDSVELIDHFKLGYANRTLGIFAHKR